MEDLITVYMLDKMDGGCFIGSCLELPKSEAIKLIQADEAFIVGKARGELPDGEKKAPAKAKAEPLPSKIDEDDEE